MKATVFAILLIVLACPLSAQNYPATPLAPIRPQVSSFPALPRIHLRPQRAIGHLRVAPTSRVVATGHQALRPVNVKLVDARPPRQRLADVAMASDARLRFSMDYLNWQVRRRDLDYGIVTDQTADAIGSGTLHEVEFGQSSGFRSSLGYAMEDNWQIAFGYTHYTASASASVSAPSGQAFVFATRSHPKFNEEADTASGQSNFAMNIFDIELRRSLVAGDKASFDIYGGVRWAENDQTFSIAYDGRDFNDGLIDNTVDISMFGLRMGAEGLWSLPNGIYVFGNAEGSIMYGDYSVALDESDFDTGSATRDTLVSVNDTYEQMVPTFSAALGAGWKHDWVEVRLGYEFTSWFNLSDRTVFLDDTHEAVFSKTNHDVMLDGFFLRTTFNY